MFLYILIAILSALVGVALGKINFLFYFHKKYPDVMQLDSSTRKGMVGEDKVRKTLIKHLKSNHFHLMNNITVKTEDERTTQIDHIAVSTSGVFVIETKSITGLIYGAIKDATWRLVSKNGNRFDMQNPHRQNFKHTQAIKKIIPYIHHGHIHSLVSFTENVTFSEVVPENTFTPKDVVKFIANQPENSLSQMMVERVVGTIEMHRLAVTKETDVEHTGYLRERFKEHV